ncbi:resistance to inhibitors of cholinesterase protein 3 isoform X7 [Periplaneta americana]|uniref:resistance to inhibitors of cholinesterase protein 3 isoform X7 n=1 Tax=Periplaneta americana TaxID=6978 RepID=UPI0037E756F9
MAVEFGTGKTIFILAIVVGCFAVLWPKLFYPMLQASVNTRTPIDSSQGHHRQERPPHLRPDMLHPALRERGRAIPQSHIVPRVVEKEGRPGPIPGMRPPMGGAGHVVPAPKGSGTMGIVMPIYTIGIVVFFMYTIMKVMFKKPGQSSVSYGDFSSDPEFRKMVFSDEYVDDQTNTYGDISRQKVKHETVTPTWKTTEENGTKLGDIEIDHLRKRLEETEAAMERIVAQMGSVPHKLHSSSGTQLIGAKVEDLSEKSKESTSAVQEEEDTKKDLHGSQKVDESANVDHASDSDKPKVQVLGMEMTASCEGGQRWSRPGTPVLGVTSHSPVPPPTPEPHSIYLEGALPSQSQLLVSESETQAMAVDTEDQDSDIDAPVILSGKMTLSLISLDAALAAEDAQEPVLGSTLDEQELESALKEEAAPEAAVSSEEEEAVARGEEYGDRRTEFEHMNDAGHGDDVPTTTNYTTASAAAEATGPEETAADYSTLESFGTNDDQQEEELEDEEEVWNGDVDSAEEESEEEEAQAHAIPQTHHHR